MFVDLKADQIVNTPYGKGKYIGVHNEEFNIVKVQPSGWVMDRGIIPTFYLNISDVTPIISTGNNTIVIFNVFL